MISFRRVVYNTFGSGIYHKPYSVFKSKFQEFHNKFIGILSGNDTSMDGYSMGMHRDSRMQNVIQTTILSE